ncbi:MAG: hypothetical protein RH917_05505 [Lacipirellulaceae bacterium]
MLEAYKRLIANQYEAALCMLDRCVEQCPQDKWHEPVANLKFCQAVFHTLFFTDLYLGEDVPSQRTQPFHQEHVAIFKDYEEIGGGLQKNTYEKPFIKAYLQHCREKAARVVAAETEETLAERPGFEWITVVKSRDEFHLYIIRHIHHHAAQLSLRLRLDTGEGVGWVGSGWRNEW